MSGTKVISEHNRSHWPQPVPPYPQVVLLGDSLFELCAEPQDGFSFQGRLQSYVMNRGFGGWNTANMVKYLPDIFPRPTLSTPRIKYLFVLLGANDAVDPMANASQHVSLEDYKDNLRTIISYLHVQAHHPQVFLITPPPLNEIKFNTLEKAWGSTTPSRRTATSARYADKVRELAKEMPGVVLIDLWKAVMDVAIAKSPNDYSFGEALLGTWENGKQGWLDQLLSDGLHLSGEGYEIFYQSVACHIRLPSKKLFPEWNELSV